MKGKQYKDEYVDGLSPGSIVYISEKSAYVNYELFLRWFEEEFLPREAARLG